MFRSICRTSLPETITFQAMGTQNTITVFEDDKKQLILQAADRVLELERRLSAFLPESDIARINQSAGIGFVNVHPETFRLLQKAVFYSRISGGAFDVTIRPLIELWGIVKKNNFIPGEEEIQNILPLIDCHDILFDEATYGIKLRKVGQALDLGGIAKGYAADETVRILKEGGIQSAMINLGGNIAAVGDHPNGRAWQIGIQNPLSARGESAGKLSIRDRSVVTSGSNERFFIKNGIRYHHLLDPRTGRPAESGLLSVTVVSESSVDADALTTALFILGPEKGAALLEKLQAQALFITVDGQVAVTPGLQDNFNLTNGAIGRNL